MNEIYLEPYYGKDGRLKVVLKNQQGEEKEFDLAGLVARTFEDKVGKAPKDLTILPKFKDGNPANCSADNLIW